MRYLSHHNPSHQKSAGFTLIEMLIIAPIVILALGGFISLMVAMVGDVIASRDENVMMYEAQDTLTRIEDDVNLSTFFLTTTGTLSTPQGSNSNFTGNAAFTNTTNTLILNTITTDRNPIDSLREIVYYTAQPNPCDATKVFNTILYSKIIYFVNAGSLWRRTVVAPNNTNSPADARTTCVAPWQQDSCSLGHVAALCQANDVEVMKNISAMNVEYYSAPNSSTDIGAANAADAKTIKVTVTGTKKSAGRDISTTQSIRATRLNSAILPPVIAPLAITGNPADQAVIHTDTNVQFSVIPSFTPVTYQWQRSTDGGTNWSNIAGATSSTYTLATVSLGMDGYKYRAVVSTPDETAISSAATLTVTIWGAIDYLNGYSEYGSPYSPIGYTRTATDVVMLKGMVKKSSAVVSGDVIGVLPPNARPNGTLIFQTSTNASTSARIDIFANGNIVVNTGDAGWISLEGINFIPTSASYTRNALTMANGWLNYGGSYSAPTYVMDSAGRVNVQGLVKSGTLTDGTQMINNLPASAKTGQYLHVPGRSSGFSMLGISATNGIEAKGTGTASYQSINTMYYPASFASWTNLTLQNGWVSYGGGYATPQYAKGSDNIVRLKGLIKSGTTTNGTVVATLPAGFRPKDRTLLGTICNPNIYCRVDILPSGSVAVYLSNATYTSLDSVVFLAEL
jgi:competence protein ComGC